jgi:hypothetical protein
MAFLTMAPLFTALPSQAGDDSDRTRIEHVLLISIDGMHAVDFINCSKGIDGGAPYCPNLAKLAKAGVNYRDTSTSKPSDSFSGSDGNRLRWQSTHRRRLLRCRL